MTFAVQFTHRSRRELSQLQDYIAARSEQGARAWLKALEKAIDSLRRNPQGASLAPEDDDHDIEVRQFLFKTRAGLQYRGLFVVIEQTIHVVHLRGPGQNLMSPSKMRFPKD